MKVYSKWIVLLVSICLFVVSFVACNGDDNTVDTPNATAINDARNFADSFFEEYPNDYLTPSFMIDNLLYSGYSESVAIYATNNCGVDWVAQARKSTKIYLSYEEEFGRPASWWTPSEIADILSEEGFSSSTIDAVLSQVVWSSQKENYLLHLLSCTNAFYEKIPNRYEATTYLLNHDVVATEAEASQLINDVSFDWEYCACAMALQIWNENGGESGKTAEEISDLLEQISSELSDLWTYTYSEIQTAMSQFDDWSIGLNYRAIDGGKSYAVTGLGRCTDKDIIIPSTYNGKDVTSISEDAFYSCTKLTSITIPDSVTSIGNYAFYGCISLTNLSIGNGVKSIGEHAFACCRNLASVTIPSNVTSIGESAFGSCDNLKNATISNGVASIGDYAFSDCVSLASVAIPDSVTSIGDYAFSSCTNLTSIVIPDSVTSIDRYAFSWCDSLTIYCEAGSKPSGWDSDWNYTNCPVVWGYTGE